MFAAALAYTAADTIAKRVAALRVLGIETTCDETAAAVVALNPIGGGTILSNQVNSQIEHAAFGGVVPEIAARAHVEILDHLIDRALMTAGVDLEDVDGIAASAGPGLIGGVLVGLTTAKTLALAMRKPLLAINHLEAHALTARLTDNVAFPYLLLLVSGGHTQLVAVMGVGDYLRLGTTLDDAIGEAFDKGAKALGLPYPGGPALEQRARQGNPERFAFPRPMLGRARPDFSLSGLKTALRLEIERLPNRSAADVDDLCASYQAAIVDVIVDRMRAGLGAFGAVAGRAHTIVAAGGVAANGAVRRALARFAAECGLTLVVPPPALCTDNAAMVAWAGIERLNLGLVDDLSVAARPRWPLDTRGTPTVHGKA